MIDIEVFESGVGSAPFDDWFNRLPASVADRIDTALQRMRLGNFGDHKRVGEGVFERRIHFGPGYRIYFGRDGDRVVILLAGGSKNTQSRDIKAAQQLWREYKRTKRRERWHP